MTIVKSPMRSFTISLAKNSLLLLASKPGRTCRSSQLRMTAPRIVSMLSFRDLGPAAYLSAKKAQKEANNKHLSSNAPALRRAESLDLAQRYLFFDPRNDFVEYAAQ